MTTFATTIWQMFDMKLSNCHDDWNDSIQINSMNN